MQFTWLSSKSKSTGPLYTVVDEYEKASPMLSSSSSSGSSRSSMTDEIIDRHRNGQTKTRSLVIALLWVTSATLVCLVVLIVIVLRGGDAGMHHAHRSAVAEGMPPQFVPEMPLAKVKFINERRFSGRQSNTTDAAWNTLLPIGRGFIYVPEREKYHLEQGISNPSGVETFSVAVFHQLHCLGVIRKRYWTLLNGLVDYNGTDPNSNATASITELRDHAEHQINDFHSMHCFDYIRQSLMCNADMTLEPPRVEKDGSRTQVTGYGAVHQCKDWDAIWQFMQGHMYTEGSNNTDIAGPGHS